MMFYIFRVDADGVEHARGTIKANNADIALLLGLNEWIVESDAERGQDYIVARAAL